MSGLSPPGNRAERRRRQRGSRAHIARMVHRRKSLPSLGSVLAVWHEDGSKTRIPLIGGSGAHTGTSSEESRGG